MIPSPEHTVPASTGVRLHTRAVLLVLLAGALAHLLILASLLRHSALTWIFTRGLETGFVAHSLLAGEGFGSPFGGHTGPTALISPGYTLIVAAVFRLFGEATHASALFILLAQIALGLLTIWLVMCLAQRLGNHRAAVVSGIFVALWPTFLWVPTIFWDTALTLCLLPGILLLALRLRDRPTLTLWLAFGGLCGFALLINLALSTVLLAVFMWTAWAAGRRRNHVAFAAIVFLAVYAPWPIRNARSLHAFIPLRTTVGLELWMGNRPGASGYLDESIFPLYNSGELRSYIDLGEVRYMQQKSSEASAAIRDHAAHFVVLSVRRFFRYWFGAGTRGGSPFYLLSSALTTILGALGLADLFRTHRKQTAWLISLPLLLFPLPYYITHAEFRYRLGLEPLLVALAAAFLVTRLAEPSPAGDSASPAVPVKDVQHG